MYIEKKKGSVIMGLDIGIYRAKNHAVFEDGQWYNNDNITEVWYARKFWDMIHNMSFVKDVEGDCGEFIPLTMDNVEEMLQFAAHNRDYFDGFSTVPQLCEIIANFEQDYEDGWHYYFHYSY